MLVALKSQGETLPGQFEALAEFIGNNQRVLPIGHYERSRDTRFLVAQLEASTACWAADGSLLHVWRSGIDLTFSHCSPSVWSLEARPGRRPQSDRHLLRRLALGTWQVEVEHALALPLGVATGLLLDEAHELALITWSDQTETGYLGFSLRDGMRRSPAAFQHATMFDRPLLVPSREVIVACQGFPTWGEDLRLCWWNDSADDPLEPSPGGIRTVGWLTTQGLDGPGEPVRHALRSTVDAGWISDNPEGPLANAIRGPVLIDEDTIRIWLPDQRPHDIRFPISGDILLDRPAPP